MELSGLPTLIAVDSGLKVPHCVHRRRICAGGSPDFGGTADACFWLDVVNRKPINFAAEPITVRKRVIMAIAAMRIEIRRNIGLI